MRNQSQDEIRRRHDELAAAAESGDTGAARAYAEFLTEDGRMDQALAWWAAAVDEGDDEAVRTLAICHKDRGEFAEAERWYRVAAGRDGGCAFGLAKLLEEAGDAAAAEEWYARGAALGSVECLTNGAVLRAERGEWDEALARLDEAYERGDRVADQARGGIREIREAWERWQGALAAAEADGDPDAAYEALDELTGPDYRSMYDSYPCLVADAEALYARAAATGSPKALVDQAILVARDPARWEEARALVVRAHELGYGGAAYVLGVWSRERGDLRAAEEWQREAAGAEGGHVYACFHLGTLCKIQWRLDEAEHWFRETGVDEDNWDPFDEDQEEVARQLKDIAALREDPARRPDPAIAARLPELRAAAEDGGPEERFAYADALDRLGRIPEAADWYRASGTPLALLDLGRMLEAAGGKSTLLLPYFEPAAEDGDAGAAHRIATIHDKAGDKRTAEIWFHRAAGLGHAHAGRRLGRLAEERGGDPQQAERWYVHAAERGLTRAAYLAGYSMVSHRRYAEAERWLTLAWEDGIPEASYYLGRALRGLGRTAEAEEWLRRAVGRYADFGRELHGLSRLDPRPELADLLVESERDEEAAPVVADILAEYPGHLHGNRYAGILARRRGDLEAAEKHFAEIEARDTDGGTGVTLREIRELLRAASG